LPSDRVDFGAASLALAGRQELLAQINKKFAGFEERLKTAGAKEPPSALGKHTTQIYLKLQNYRLLMGAFWRNP